MQNFVYAEIVVGKVFELVGLLEEPVEETGVENLADSVLGAGPAVLYVLELGNDFAHLIAVNGDVFIEELLDTVGTEVQENGDLLQLIIIGGLIDMNDIGKYFRQGGKHIVIDPPLDLGQKVPKDSQFVRVNEHLLANSPHHSIQRVLEIVLSAEWHLDHFFY